jgi:hypothetical protein
MNVTVSIDGFEVTFGAVQDWNGSETLTFTVEDDSSGTASDTVNVIVTPVNDVPVLTEVGAETTDEDTQLILTLEATDAEEDDLSFSASSDNDTVNVSIDGDQLTMTPDPNYFGTANITVSVSDGFLTAEGTFVLTINPVPDAPVALNVAVSPAVPEGVDDLSLIHHHCPYLDSCNSG